MPASARWSRRDLLKASAGASLAAGLGGAPRPTRASSASDRRFVFVFCNGGWDLTWGLVPMFDNPRVDCPTDGSEATEAGGHRIVDGPERPALKAWFDRWGPRTAFLHGFEVRSVAHLNCRRLLFTGESSAFADDWPTLIASQGVGNDVAMPYLIASGPGYAANHPDLAARVGADGQLGALLNLQMLSRRDVPAPPLQSDNLTAVSEYLQARAEAQTAAAATEAGADLYAAIGRHQGAIPELEVAFASTNIHTADTFPDQLRLACDVLEGGISRCALVKHNGFNNMTWDNHGGISGQVLHYQDLFEGLEVLMQELMDRTDPSGGNLLEDTCVVVMSEMSRHPVANVTNGKDHWTWTSAMLIGSGVQGGKAAGGYDEHVFGLPIDPVTGDPSPAGITMQSRHFGATLLALAGIDPTPYFSVETPPIEGLLT